MFRYRVAENPDLHTSYGHQFQITATAQDSWTTRGRAEFVSTCIKWCEANVGVYGDRWLVRDFAFLFRVDVDAVAFKMRWG